MICKKCGTESGGAYCPHCGEELVMEPVADKEETVAEAAPGKTRKVQDIPRVKKVSSFRIRFAALMLFLPLIYLFVDVFVTLSDSLFSKPGGEPNIFVFISRLFSVEYAMHPVEEIKLATLGKDGALLQMHAARDFSGAGEMLVPLLAVLVLALLSALAGLLLLVLGKKLLRRRLTTDLVLIFGAAGAFAPAIGMIVRRLLAFLDSGLAGADAGMFSVMPTVEAILTMAICAVMLLPALVTVRRASAGERGALAHVSLSCNLIGGGSFGFAKLAALLSVFACIGIGAAFFVSPIFIQGEMAGFAGALESIKNDGGAFFSSLMAALKGQGGEIDLFLMTDIVNDALCIAMPCIALLFLLRLLPSILRICTAKKHTLCTKRKAIHSLKRTDERTLRLVALPFVLVLFAQVVLLLFFCLASKLLMHVDFAAVQGTLEILYVFIGYVRMLCGINTLYVFLALGGMLCTEIAEQYSLKMITISHEKG